MLCDGEPTVIVCHLVYGKFSRYISDAKRSLNWCSEIGVKCGDVVFCKFVCVFLCASVNCAACSEVMVELVEDYVGVVEVVAVGYIDCFVFGNIAALMLSVAFRHTYLQLWR